MYTAVMNKINGTSEADYSADNANKIAELKAQYVTSVNKIQNGSDTDATKAEAYVTEFKKFKEAVDAIPVSYTHLDVYKRQPKTAAAFP